MAMTPNEHAHLQEEWTSLAKDHLVNGMCVWQGVFRKHPEYQKLFEAYAPRTWESLSGSVRMMCHAQYIMKAVGQAVSLAANDAGLTNFLHRIGGEHVQRKTTAEHFKNFFPVLLDQLVLCNAGKLHRDIWTKFFDICVAKIAEGLKNPVEAGVSPSDEAIRDIFIAWDTDRDGALDAHELLQVMVNLAPNQSEETVKAIIAEADTNKDGKVQFNEFLAIFRAKK